MSKPAKTRRKPTKPKTRKPRILVLEGAGGSATDAVIRSGATPIRINPRDLDKVENALTEPFDGLLLTGGGDVDPRTYGEKPTKQVYGVSEVRDYAEWITLDRARQRGVPVMGICRGMQLIAIHNGGALRQHVNGHRGGKHIVWSETGSKFRRVIGHETGVFPSLHHQIVRRTGGKGMKVAGRSREGYIEAIENATTLAVQFHPEYDYAQNEASRRLFDWLARAAARKARLPKPTRVKRQPVQQRHGLLGQAQLPTVGGLPYDHPVRQATRKTTVASTWVCRDCGLRFDEKRDRDDHAAWVCGDQQRVTTEPPPGHPDWEHDDATRMDRELDAIIRNGHANIARERRES